MNSDMKNLNSILMTPGMEKSSEQSGKLAFKTMDHYRHTISKHFSMTAVLKKFTVQFATTETVFGTYRQEKTQVHNHKGVFD